jgi:hypothetical protein
MNYKHFIRHVIFLVITTIISFLLLPVLFNFLLNNFATSKYNSSSYLLNLKYYWLGFIVYCCIAYKLNISTLKFLKKDRLRNLIIQMIIDVLIIPTSILVLIIKNNTKPDVQILSIGSLINVYLILSILMVKHIILLIIFKRFFR